MPCRQATSLLSYSYCLRNRLRCVVAWLACSVGIAYLMHRTVAPFSRMLRPSRWASSGARRAWNRVPSCASLPTNQRQLHLAVTDHRQGALGGPGVAQRSCGFPSRRGVRHECVRFSVALQLFDWKKNRVPVGGLAALPPPSWRGRRRLGGCNVGHPRGWGWGCKHL